MGTKIIQLADSFGNKEYPITSSAAVGLSDGSGNLDRAISSLSNKIIHIVNITDKTISSGLTGVKKVGDTYFYSPSKTLYRCSEFTANDKFKVKEIKKEIDSIIYNKADKLFYLFNEDYDLVKTAAITYKDILALKRDKSYLFSGRTSRSDRYINAGYFEFLVDANLAVDYNNDYFYFLSSIDREHRTFGLMKKSLTSSSDVLTVVSFKEESVGKGLSLMKGNDSRSWVVVDWNLYHSDMILSGTSYNEGVSLNPFLFNRKIIDGVELADNLDNLRNKGFYKILGASNYILLVREERNSICQLRLLIYNNEIVLEKRVYDKNKSSWDSWIKYDNEIKKEAKSLNERLLKITKNIIGASSNLLDEAIFSSGRINYTNGKVIDVSQGANYKISVNPNNQSYLKVRVYKNKTGSDTEAGYAFLDKENVYITGDYYKGDKPFGIEIVSIPSNASFFINTAPQNRIIEEGVYAIYNDTSTLYIEIINIIKRLDSIALSTTQIEDNRKNIKDNQLNIVKWFGNLKTSMVKNDESPLKILFIGNSFAVQSTRYLPDLLKSVGKNIVIGVAYAGGATLQYYDTYKDNLNIKQVYRKYKNGWVYNNDDFTNTLLDKINDEGWDLICMQQGSASAGAISTYQPYYSSLRKWVEVNAPITGYKDCWLMAWAWTDNKISTEGGNLDGGKNNKEMYDNILSATKSIITDNNINFYFPSGLVVENLLQKYTQEQIWLDGQHLEPIGALASAMTLFRKITSYYWETITLDDITYNSSYSVSEEDFNSIREIVKKSDFDLTSYEFKSGNDYNIYYDFKTIKGTKWDVTLVSIEHPENLTSNIAIKFRKEKAIGTDASTVASFSKRDIGQTQRVTLTDNASYLFLYNGFLNVNAKIKLKLVG